MKKVPDLSRGRDISLDLLHNLHLLAYYFVARLFAMLIYVNINSACSFHVRLVLSQNIWLCKRSVIYYFGGTPDTNNGFNAASSCATSE